MESEVNLRSHLSPRLIIRGADSHLYRIGLSLDQSSPDSTRNYFYQPWFVFCLTTHLFVHQTVIILVPQKEQAFHVRIGDVGQLIGVKVPLAQASAVVGLLASVSQIFNYLNHKNGVKSTELNVFRMMAGQLTPNSLGITDVRSLTKLLKVSLQTVPEESIPLYRWRSLYA